ncbi:hypothetical protein MKX08_008663 [Trichoderma sp. CBMAI-0020]|nr:hypothetical protein MKX08_008663 [Trichoderma sp. CBMAI-0020]
MWSWEKRAPCYQRLDTILDESMAQPQTHNKDEQHPELPSLAHTELKLQSKPPFGFNKRHVQIREYKKSFPDRPPDQI